MELKDIPVGIIYLMLIYLVAYAIRPKLTNENTRPYFIPALSVKIIGAVFLGVIYQFYYGGGDTFNYFNQAKVVYEALISEPLVGIKLLCANGEHTGEIFNYSRRIWWFKAQPEYMVIRLTGLFSVFTFASYSAVAFIFAFISFLGLWMMYLTLLDMYAKLYKEFAIAIFFIPSVFFWGSGLMKDTVVMGCLGFMFWASYEVAIKKRSFLKGGFVLLICFYLVSIIKIYVLLAFVPPFLFWIFQENRARIRNKVVKWTVTPFLIVLAVGAAYMSATMLTAGDAKYDVDNIAERTKINAEYLHYVSVKQGGSAYNLGELDGTFGGIMKLVPAAINVSLYRPYLWEVGNPLMLLSSLESLFFFCLTCYAVYMSGFSRFFQRIFLDPFLLFSLVFTLILAAAVGLNSFNFGSLVRYKIPFVPFYSAGLYILFKTKKSYAQAGS